MTYNNENELPEKQEKKATMGWALLAIIIVASAALLNIALNKANIPTTSDKTGTGTSVSTGTVTKTETASGASETTPTDPQLDIKEETLDVVYNPADTLFVNEELLASLQKVGKENKQTLNILKNDDAKVKNIVEALGEDIYYPLFVFSTNSPNIDYKSIDKELIVVDEAAQLFAFREPFFARLPKITMNKSVKMNAALEKFKMPFKRSDAGNTHKILLIEDPLCPFCAQAFHDTALQEEFSAFTQEVIYFPPTTHPNSNKIIGILRANPDVHYELLGKIFSTDPENDVITKLSSIKEEQVFEEVKKIAEAAGITGLKDGEKYTDEELKELEDLLISLNVQGTPSFFVVGENSISQTVNLEALDKIKNK